MKYTLKILCLLGVIYSINALSIDNHRLKEAHTRCVPGHPETSNAYLSTKWYLDSAEQSALYNQAFNVGLEKIKLRVKSDKLKKSQWGVVFDIDETVLNNMKYDQNIVVNQCKNFDLSSWDEFLDKEVSTATPGAVNITCSIKKMGGYVALVSNRNITNHKDIIKATVGNLNKVGICYDTILFASNKTGNNKNSRFMAVTSGKYDNLSYTKKIPAIDVVAYFGDNIQDFPNYKQSEVLSQSTNSSFFANFGKKYFILPNPIYGSWLKNKFN
jgi:5'-nucleotidase (lipoprotein e(P4) family)